jgi:RNA polymerase sigma-70 factor (ECF subfamily)
MSDLALEDHRHELTGYCYRMLGSAFEADDAVQETMVRAWKAADRFEGRSSVRSWLYKIATNVCLDQLRGRQRRAMPMDLGPASRAEGHVAPPVSEATWVQPVPTSHVLDLDGGDPADRAVERESIRLAFVTALQHLPPRQRAVLILREVLRWQASEVAELLGTTVASVNSALQRARATLDAKDLSELGAAATAPVDEALLDDYVDAFERYDVKALVAMLHEEVTFSMPPFPMWLNTPEDVGKWFVGPGAECEGSRLLRVDANGATGLAQWRPPGPDGKWIPWSIQVIEADGGRITSIHNFLGEALFPYFGLSTTEPRRLIDA